MANTQSLVKWLTGMDVVDKIAKAEKDEKTNRLLLWQSTASKWWKTTILNLENQKYSIHIRYLVFLLSSFLS